MLFFKNILHSVDREAIWTLTVLEPNWP